MANTTARPWRKDKYAQIIGPDGTVVTVWGLGIAHGQRTPEHEENGQLIFTAVNAFDSMKAALEKFVGAAQSCHEFHNHRRFSAMRVRLHPDCQAALTLAESETK